MMCFRKWLAATFAVLLLAGVAAAADTVSGGKVKSINAENKTFVLTDSSGKDFTFSLADNAVINRAGTESKGDLKSGDAINVGYDKGLVTWTAHYILVQEGKSLNNELIRGNVKGYDADKKELSFTNENKKDSTYPMGKAEVRCNMEDAKIENIKIGDHALLIVNTVDGRSTLECMMVDRPKSN